MGQNEKIHSGKDEVIQKCEEDDIQKLINWLVDTVVKTQDLADKEEQKNKLEHSQSKENAPIDCKCDNTAKNSNTTKQSGKKTNNRPKVTNNRRQHLSNRQRKELLKQERKKRREENKREPSNEKNLSDVDDTGPSAPIDIHVISI